jgi:hypothetical protein
MRVYGIAAVLIALLLATPVLGAQRMVLVEDFTNYA